jgi:hypothetical protein
LVKKAGDLPSVGALRAERTIWLGADAASTEIRAARWDSVAPADAEAQIRSFLEAIEPMMGSSLVTLEKVQVLRYGPDAT